MKNLYRGHSLVHGCEVRVSFDMCNVLSVAVHLSALKLIDIAESVKLIDIAELQEEILHQIPDITVKYKHTNTAAITGWTQGH